MAWTTPRTWTTGELVTAAMMNTHLRDNLNALGDGASVWRATAQSINNATNIPIAMDAVQFNDGFWVVGSPTRLTVPAGWGGRYRVSGQIRYASGGTNMRFASIRRNGITSLSSGGNSALTAYTTDSIAPPISTVLAAGDYIELVAYHDAGAAISTDVSAGVPLTWLSLEWIGA